MPRASIATCPHPIGRRKQVSMGFYQCGRCGFDITPEGRTAEVRISPRVTVKAGEGVWISNYGKHRDRGTFFYADPGKDEMVAIVWTCYLATRKGQYGACNQEATND